MNKEYQVTSLELSKRLKELGVKQESLFYWIKVGINVVTCEENWKVEGLIHNLEVMPPNYISAFTVAELGELIGQTCNEWAQGYNDCYSQWYFRWGNRGAGSMIEGIGKSCFSDQEFEGNARAELLLHILSPDKYPVAKDTWLVSDILIKSV